MKNKASRRKFIKHVGLGSVAAGFMPASLSANTNNKKISNDDNDEKNISAHTFNQTYSGEYLNRVAFPVGGIGAGMFCMEGTGAFHIYLYAISLKFLMSPMFCSHFGKRNK